ncbi:MaoC/PaaZ C-terminal domain-containing protein [uncultured Megasphaera sp.]|jgi:acyl dehydratase|uniref:MaoC/PaaZ C-terminal domain-containing protein n=1 Tax=uncultured Megasphaera sp. TaxID=165188 RepID=UPI0025EBA657|nr:MaoC/PaaZ C-terminal domain-containing protein [uncultured Megasphaera sp.]
MNQKPQGKFFDEFQENQTFGSASRTITQADIVNFAGLSGDFNPLHMDHEFGKKSPHGSIIAHGALTFAVTTGLFNSTSLVDGTNIAFLGLSFDYKKVVKIGDTLHLDISIDNKRLTSKGNRGVVTFHVLTKNQRDEVVLDGLWKMLIMCSPEFKK